MAQKRYINTSFWKDGYIVGLNPLEKLLFNYFLSNSQTNIAGVYEITLREIAFDTGIEDSMVKKMVQRFEDDKKVIYRGGWLVMINWQKHQSKSDTVQQGIKRIMDEIPTWLKDLIESVKSGQTDMLESLEV